MSESNLSTQWDEARTAFASSIMVDTALSSLAENLDGPVWPGTGKKDAPADYIDLNHEEVTEFLALRGYPESALEDLITILTETLAFDDPFGDMVEQSETAAETENPLLENLKKLEIPESFPIAMTTLAPDAKEFCALEKLNTLSEFAVFAQGMSQSVIVGGDFKMLLNALSHVDEQSIAKFLPFRPGHKGLHLIEGVGGLVRSLRDLERQKLSSADSQPSPETAARVAELAKYFDSDVKKIEARLAEGIAMSREVMVLQDPLVEAVVVNLLTPHLAGAEPVKKSGWLGRLFGR